MVDTSTREQLRARVTVGAVASVAYAVACYLSFVLVLLYAVCFSGGFVVPRTVDDGGPGAGTLLALVIDGALLNLFAVQHSVMARPAFKRLWTRWVPAHLERSTYVLAASAALALLFWQWRPSPGVVWDVSWSPARVALYALFAAGWLWMVAMTFAIDHWDLFGLARVARHLRGLADRSPAFAVPWPYRLARHPMMLGFFPALLAAPTMTVGHLVFSGLSCGYIVAGSMLEERDLAAELPEYDAYAATTPRFFPRLRSVLNPR
jgi:protein-S-isoprenylcysteine O-methyltransferase Ste14